MRLFCERAGAVIGQAVLFGFYCPEIAANLSSWSWGLFVPHRTMKPVAVTTPRQKEQTQCRPAPTTAAGNRSPNDVLAKTFQATARWLLFWVFQDGLVIAAGQGTLLLSGRWPAPRRP
jgi:hypothetical protein